MKKIKEYILILLLASTAVLSCSTAPDMALPDKDMANGAGLVISGIVADMEDGSPLEEIKLTLHAAEISGSDATTIFDKAIVYTDNNGLYTFKAEGFMNPISCIIIAEDPNGVYASANHEIPLISWDSSYNMTGGIFYINECDFHLKKL